MRELGYRREFPRVKDSLIRNRLKVLEMSLADPAIASLLEMHNRVSSACEVGPDLPQSDTLEGDRPLSQGEGTRRGNQFYRCERIVLFRSDYPRSLAF